MARRLSGGVVHRNKSVLSEKRNSTHALFLFLGEGILLWGVAKNYIMNWGFTPIYIAYICAEVCPNLSE